ncbi:MAG: hypothetical protein R8K47_07260 [Mariprofundaceae bacterium]
MQILLSSNIIRRIMALRREIALALAVKAIAIALIWRLFFAGQQAPEIMPPPIGSMTTSVPPLHPNAHNTGGRLP